MVVLISIGILFSLVKVNHICIRLKNQAIQELGMKLRIFPVKGRHFNSMIRILFSPISLCILKNKYVCVQIRVCTNTCVHKYVCAQRESQNTRRSLHPDPYYLTYLSNKYGNLYILEIFTNRCVSTQ